MQMVGPAYMDYQLNGRSGGPMSNEHPVHAAAPHGVFPCQGDDRWISIAVASDEEWQHLLTALGHPEWLKVAEFATQADRLKHIDTLHKLIGEWTPQYDDRALAELLQKHGVEYNVLTTVNRVNANYPLEVYRFLRDEARTDWMQFIPVVERINEEFELYNLTN